MKAILPRATRAWGSAVGLSCAWPAGGRPVGKKTMNNEYDKAIISNYIIYMMMIELDIITLHIIFLQEH